MSPPQFQSLTLVHLTGSLSWLVEGSRAQDGALHVRVVQNNLCSVLLTGRLCGCFLVLQQVLLSNALLRSSFLKNK